MSIELFHEMLGEYEKICDKSVDPLREYHSPDGPILLNVLTLNPKYKSLWTTEFLTKEQFKELFAYVEEEENLYEQYKIPFKYFIMTRFTFLLWVDEDIPILQRYTVSEQMALITKRFRKDRVNRILQSSPAYLDYVFSLDPVYLVENCIDLLKDDESNFDNAYVAYCSGDIMWFELDEDEWMHNLDIIKAYANK